MKIKLSRKTALLFVIVWFLLASIMLDFWPIIRNEGEFATATHELYGFSIDYPTKWKISQYGENGYRGNDDLKMQISRNNVNNFRIFIYQTNASDATLNDAYLWHMQTINRLYQPEFKYSEISLYEDEVRGYRILRHNYIINSTKFEAVYLIRSNDMVHIKLQAPIDDFDNYLDEFNAIVVSFRPFELPCCGRVFPATARSSSLCGLLW